MFHHILSVTCDVESGFAAVLSALNDSMALASCQDKRITDLEKAQARLQALAIFTDPIEVFRDFVAEKTGRGSWQRLASHLYLERYRESKPARAEVAWALSCMGLDLSVWDGIRQVANAGSAANRESHQGQDAHPKLLRSMVSKGVLPEDLGSCSAAMTRMLDWLDNAM